MAAVCRKMDNDIVHCSLPKRDMCSPDVNANGRGISRVTDINTIHQYFTGNPFVPCLPHTAPIASGSTSVLINQLGAGRIGDPVNGPNNPCTAVAEGSPDVFAGD